MEQVHAELVRLAGVLDVVTAHVETEGTRAWARSKHDRHRLTHREMRDTSHTSLSGIVWIALASKCSCMAERYEAILKYVAHVDRFDTVSDMDAECWAVQLSTAAMAAARVTWTRGEVVLLMRRVVNADPENGIHF